MGTLASFVADGRDRETTLAALNRMVTTIETVEAEISTWQKASVFSKLNVLGIGKTMKLPSIACNLLERSYYWWRQTDGAFDPALGHLVRRSLPVVQSDGLPPDSSLTPTDPAVVGLAHVEFNNETCTVARREQVAFDLGGVGKGAALDAAKSVMADYAYAWMINFGGQLIVENDSWPVELVHFDTAEQGSFNFKMGAGSIATSRFMRRLSNKSEVHERSHIFDPRTRRPITKHRAVSVWSERAIDADILSTALLVMGLRDGFKWAIERDIAALFSIRDDLGEIQVTATPQFAKRLQND